MKKTKSIQGIVKCDESGTIVECNNCAKSILSPTGEIDKPIYSYLSRNSSKLIREFISSTSISEYKEHGPVEYDVFRHRPNDVYLLHYYKIPGTNLTQIYLDCVSYIVKEYIDYQNKVIQKTNSILKATTEVCRDLISKNRSHLEEILITISSNLTVEESFLCYQNGTYHGVECKKNEKEEYITNKNDGELSLYHQDIWTIALSCNDFEIIEEYGLDTIIIPLKVQSSMIGFIKLVTKQENSLSDAQVYSIKSLGDIVSYIIYNKEETRNLIEFARNKLKIITGSEGFSENGK